MAITRLRVIWTGTPITGGGLSTFFVSGSVPGATTALGAFFTAIKALVPPGVTWQIPNTGDVLNELDGALIGAWTDTAQANVTSSGSTSFPAGVGTRIVWNTAGIHKGRRVRGSTFIVPLTTSQFDTDGTLGVTGLGTLNGAASALATALSSSFVIWSRPSPGIAGAVSPIVSHSLPDRVSWLRSRRT